MVNFHPGIREKVVAVTRGVLTLLTGAVIICSAFLSLCAAEITGLIPLHVPVLAADVTGTALALIGTVISSQATDMKKSNFKP